MGQALNKSLIVFGSAIALLFANNASAAFYDINVDGDQIIEHALGTSTDSNLLVPMNSVGNGYDYRAGMSFISASFATSTYGIDIPVCSDSDNGHHVKLNIWNGVYHVDSMVAPNIQIESDDNIVACPSDYSPDRTTAGWVHFSTTTPISLGVGIFVVTDLTYVDVSLQSHLISGEKWNHTKINSGSFTDGSSIGQLAPEVYRNYGSNSLFAVTGICSNNYPSNLDSNCSTDNALWLPDFVLRQFIVTEGGGGGGGGGDTIIGTSTYPTFSTSTCGITSGSEIYGCIQNAFIWGFYPPQSSFDDFTALGVKLSKKPPMGYVTGIITAFNISTTTASSSVEIEGFEPIFGPIRAALVIIFYIFGAVWFFRRVKNIVI